MFEFDLDSVLSTPTTPRVETVVEEASTDASTDDLLNNLTFDESLEPTPVEVLEPEVVEVFSEKEVEENAAILVDLIDTVNVATLTPLARWKLRKKRGGKQVVTQMQLIYEKSLNKEEKLTKEEKNEILKYKAYLSDKEELESAIPYTREEKERLTRAAKNYVRSKKIKINGDLSFWGELAMIQGTRIMQILTA